jgi:hypothetical protein
MIPCEPRYRLSNGRLTALRDAVEAHLPLVDANVAMEAVARGLGYQTYAILATGLSADTRRPVDGVAAAELLSEHGIPASPSLFHHALATFAVREVLDVRYNLNQVGIELPRRQDERFRFGLREQMDERQHALSRAEMRSPQEAPGQIRALAFASVMTGSSSYAGSDRLNDYKHAAEVVSFALSDGTILGPAYVPAGIMAAGLLYAGFAANAKERFKVSAGGFRDFKAAAGIPYFFRGKRHTGAVCGDRSGRLSFR